ncbi:MAG TPA: zinc-dependent metalloprotease [Candidatus Eisenbacteria bacterium]|nr:zinc-dependent metalloprotease [Candidatus Eisenbacteria bacterium]
MLRFRLLLLTTLLSVLSSFLIAADTKPTPTIHEFTAGMKAMDGLFPMFWDAKAGRVYLKVNNFDQDFLFLTSLPYGLGSNDVGLDRGKLGEGIIVHFSRVGPKVLLMEPNLDYRSSSSNPSERMAVTQSFAESVVAGFKVEAEENAAVVIDVTDFLQSDQFGVAKQLAESKQGTYKVDKDRSAIALDGTKNFPQNTEIEAMLTFVTDKPAEKSLVATVSPDAYAVTMREHYSFVQLPDAGFRPRAFDPRAGYFEVMYRDYSAPLGSPLDVRFISRHRLQKKDPSAAMSEPVKPIVYYVDRGAPEPIRSALLDGASWWAQAFEAAGFKNAFRVEVMPAGADPMDVRYNVIQWVHRSTRGWSYGRPVVDPRTGEILKGQVTLGSLRARQDYLIAEALLSPYKKGITAPTQLQEMVLARLRQLAAHEVGHTLGLAHNFAASAIAPGTSVMDYPHPWVTLNASGHPDVSRAYATGVGAWDKVAIQYGYSQFAPDADEHAALDAILTKAQANGLYFITDQDSRPQGGAHPYAHLWDNGPDPAAELDRILKVRAAALSQSGEDAIPMGRPMAEIEDTLVPLYLLHRYQTEAAAKEIGGLNYRYALRGDGQMVSDIVSPANQRKALDALLQTLKPETLTLPESLLRMLPPRPPAYPRTQESFTAHTGVTFDPESAAEAATEITVGLLFNPQRASRLVEYHARDSQNPGLQEVIEATLAATWKAPRATGLQAETQRVTETAVSEHLLALAANSAASGEARAISRAEAVSLRDWIAGATTATAEDKALHAATLARIDLFLKQPDKFTPAPAPAVPPGQPIGDEE